MVHRGLRKIDIGTSRDLFSIDQVQSCVDFRSLRGVFISALAQKPQDDSPAGESPGERK